MSIDVARRLEAIDRRHPKQDADEAEAALKRHFSALGIWRPKTIQWCATTREAWEEVLMPMEDGDREFCAFHERMLAAEIRALLNPWAWWSPTALESDGRFDPAIRAAWASPDHALFKELSEPYWSLDGNLESAPLCSSALLAAALAGRGPSEPMERRALLAMLEAAEAGLWLFWPRRDVTVAVMRPSIWAEDWRLHRWDGPAVTFPDGREWHYWRGVRVPAEIADRRESMPVSEILSTRNVEVRRLLIERFGLKRLLEATKATPVQADACGRLYRIDLPSDEPLVLVQVTNATPEPDGTRREYVLRVPPAIRTAREAVAWTFNLKAENYSPSVET